MNTLGAVAAADRPVFLLDSLRDAQELWLEAASICRAMSERA